MMLRSKLTKFVIETLKREEDGKMRQQDLTGPAETIKLPDSIECYYWGNEPPIGSEHNDTEARHLTKVRTRES